MYRLIVPDVFEKNTDYIILEKLTQYDQGICVQFSGELPEEYRLEECLTGDKVTQTCERVESGVFKISDDLLKDGRDVQLYLFMVGDKWGRTVLSLRIPIERRPARV